MNAKHYFVMTALVCLSATLGSTVHAQTTAFRISDLDWRDPHLFSTSVVGCIDITNFDNFGIKGINPTLQLKIQTDTDSDNELDLNYLIVFDPVNPAIPGGTLWFGADVTCTAPLAGTSCSPLSLLPSYVYDNTPSPCLNTIPGTINLTYSPGIVTPSTPCFVASLGTVTLNAFIPLTLHDAYMAAAYQGMNPVSGLVNGLIRGFISEADANATILPASYVPAGGQALSSLLRGGVNSCSQPSPSVGDKDTGPGGVAGWYVYLNFTASVVPLVSATPVPHVAASSFELEAPAPNPFNPITTIRYTLPHTATTQLSIYDAAGHRVAELANGSQNAGPHEKIWNGRDTLGLPVSSGVYFVRLESAGEMRVRKIVLLK